VNRSAALAAVLTLLVVSTCGSNDASPPASPPDQPSVVDALSEARGAAIDGDPSLARTLFFDRAHDRLHELAAAVSDIDRSIEARLLEAEQRVEADLSIDRAPDLAAHLAALAAVAADATEANGDPRP